jgi:hypothetical protein
VNPGVTEKNKNSRNIITIYICTVSRSNITRPHGPMARRLTTNQEIAGSIPAVVTSSYLFILHRFTT